ncbi:acyl transferase/acyl hydrolase/lysophospholipase [Podospora fimiseda]|uniref:Acyl transferase/acyl hydrolase/lysophospholipase n=1 Tax=Podospora fimiseda TaxID=252190 RepID=A0AAN7BLC3_9PEZI|nr:acyl transferase/acyl hydrolase/lysophospholipase [Podospora fimiseda]
MQKIQDLINKETSDSNNPFSHAVVGQEPADGSSGVTPNNQPLPLLPCYFFDFMIGTSTGGLVAILLGRLRMSIDDAIKSYWRLGNYIFYPGRQEVSPHFPYLLYDSKKLERAIKETVWEHCDSHPRGTECNPTTERLRQYDYAEEDDANCDSDPSRQNYTCKVAVVAQKRTKLGQMPHLFRSYNHSTRAHVRNDYNPDGDMTNSAGGKVTIVEACRATSASPLHFKRMKIYPDTFIDGGAGHNNPSKIAWNEALYMSHLKDATQRDVAALISLGCGEKREEGHNNFKGLLKTLTRSVAEISATHHVHDYMETICDNAQIRTPYFRFNVTSPSSSSSSSSRKGLSDIGLAECKKETKKGIRKAGRDARRKVFNKKTNSWPSSNQPPRPKPEWYVTLQRQAQQQSEESGKQQTKGAFRPDKYDYTTFDTIFERTEEYCTSTDKGNGHGGSVVDRIDQCAELLLRYARLRAIDRERWRRFISHPDPYHPLYIVRDDD